jgi:hypothetical protein
MEEPGLEAALGIDCRHHIRLEEIARAASKSHVPIVARAISRKGHNVLDLERQVENRFGGVAILTAVSGPFGHLWVACVHGCS